jgi:acetylornithine deacetylase/succinyl-diaminopimelate desuccinylase-like protein
MSRPEAAEAAVDEAVSLLRELVRVNTVNPPGNETLAQELLATPLRDAGFDADRGRGGGGLLAGP